MANMIAEKLGVEAIHLDSLHWLPGWVENTSENEISALRPVLNSKKWVIDGNYSKVLYNERMDMADTIVFLDFNRFLCIARVIKRYLKYKGVRRPDMGEGCDEKLDFEFVRWVLYKGRKSKIRKRKLSRLSEHKTEHPEKDICILRNPRQVREFLKSRNI